MDKGFFAGQITLSLKTKSNHDSTNKFTLDKSTRCLRLKEVKTKEYRIYTLAFHIFISESKITTQQ